MTKTLQKILVSKITTGNNDRTVFKQEDIESLAASIVEHGLIQPITVNSDMMLIAGERRFRAVQFLGHKTIDGFIVDLSPEEAAAIMLAENTARTNLDPIDEARAYQIRIDRYAWTVDECAKYAGVSSVTVHNRLKLLTLRDDLHLLIRTGSLMIGYAQILAESNLDTNRQMLAFNALRDNKHPTPGWLRGVCNLYREQQNTVDLFDTGEFLKCQIIPDEKLRPIDPPSPSTTIPPKVGKNIKDVIKNQIMFWNDAALAWKSLGKPFKAQEASAAALALQYTIK
jgi:ParB family chromosome partitioning protein